MSNIRLSATAIQDWLECSRRFLYRYEYGLRPDEDRDSQRIGTTWHNCHEIIRMVPQSKCPTCMHRGEVHYDCYLCDGTGRLPQDMMEAVTRYVNHAYAEVPDNKSREEWEVERIGVLYSFSGYRWYFDNSRFENLASEVWFDNPVVNPITKREMQGVKVVGKTDHILRDKESGLIYIGERKSTSTGIDNMDYWARLEMDVQVTLYMYELRIAQMTGKLRKYGISEDDPLIHGAWYDVWHKPSIKPKALSQKDTAEFLSCGVYCGEKFAVGEDNGAVFVNDDSALTVPGKKGFAIRETPEMFGARLLADICERPEFYFEQREIARDDRQLEEFEQDLCRIVRAIRTYRSGDLWVPNCRSCSSPFWCDFRSLCMNHVPVGPNDVPEGFKKGK